MLSVRIYVGSAVHRLSGRRGIRRGAERGEREGSMTTDHGRWRDCSAFRPEFAKCPAADTSYGRGAGAGGGALNWQVNNSDGFAPCTSDKRAQRAY
jgi:hypothetical protein